jgi:ABC-type nitrate/sulfonate/bicarbonate transport system permease component
VFAGERLWQLKCWLAQRVLALSKMFARTVSDYELIWVTILIMGSLGLIFDLMMRWVIGRLIPWRGKG